MTLPHNPERGEFVVNLGGKERIGQLQMEQICAIEVALGQVSLINLMTQGRFGFEAMCQLYAAALAAKNPKIQVMHVRKWVQNALNDGTGTVADFTMLAQSVLMRSMGKKELSALADKERESLAAGEDPDAEGAPSAPLPDVDGPEDAPRPLAPTANPRRRSA